MGYKRAAWHSGLTYSQTCETCHTQVTYTDYKLGFRPWYPDGFVYCPTCKTPLRHNEKYAIDRPDAANAPDPTQPTAAAQPASAAQPTAAAQPASAAQPTTATQPAGLHPFCSKCGRAFCAGENFCPKCGNKR